MSLAKLAAFSILFFICTVNPVAAGEYLNKHLPGWINADLQLRHRYEWRSNFDFSDAVDDTDGLNLWRGRLGLTLKPAKGLKLYYQFQDARVSDDSTSGSKATLEDWAETRQLWGEGQLDNFKPAPLGLTGIILKIGRQEFSYGSQRLIGPVNWSNVGQIFDAGKLSFKFADRKLDIDIFAGGKVLIKSPREQNDLYDGSANDRLSGYYVLYSGLKNTTIEQYVLNRNTDGKTVSFRQTGDGEIEDYTIGARAKGKLAGTSFDYEIEAAKQVGNSGALDVDAQMAIAILGYTFDNSWKPRLAFEFNYASGDSDASDGQRATFDNLYPTNHLFYGYMDFVSLQNINNYRLQLNVFPHQRLELAADTHFIFLDSSKDSLYAANQTVKRATAAGAGTHVGNEIDLLAKFQATKSVEILAGYSHLFAGEFLKDTGADDDADFAYIQTTLNF